MNIRRYVFWAHLATGVIAGSVIFTMGVTGTMMAFEPQVTAFAERGVRRVASPAADAKRLTLEAAAAAAQAARPEAKLTGVTIQADDKVSVTVNFNRGGAVFVDPYTGKVLGGESRVRGWFRWIESVHRRLGTRDKGRLVTDACSVALLFMVFSGIFLWWPRKWSRTALKAVTLFNPRLSGKARDWNRHNVIGIWCAPLFLITALTGILMAYPRASDLLCRMAGSVSPPKASVAVQGTARKPGEPSSGLDAFWARAAMQAPGWSMINIRLPQKPSGMVVVMVQESGRAASQRSQLTLDPQTAEVVKWEPFSGYNNGKKLKSWFRPLHTGQAFGPVGQFIMCFSGIGAACMVWTGLSLAWRRFRGRSAGPEPKKTL